MNGTSDDDDSYDTEWLWDVSKQYMGLHGYLSLSVCAVGIPLNIITITVLTRRNMQTPINCILTWLAVSDIATMISYVPFAYHFYCEHDFNEMSAAKNSEQWMNFLVVNLNLSATTHTISIWLGVALAIFRHRHIQSPAKGNLTRIRRLIRARLVVCAIYVLSVLLMIPNYMSYKLESIPYTNNSTMYGFEPWYLGTSKVKPIVLVSLFMYSIVAKLVPCILIIVYGGFLLRTLNNTMKHKRRRLSSGTSTSQRSIDTSRTTVMLLIVIVLFLVMELPQGVLILCCLFIKKFFENVYIPLGDMMDIIALINSGINFILYCTMSQEFRKTFIQLYCSFSFSSRERQKSYVTTETNTENMQTTLLKMRPLPER